MIVKIVWRMPLIIVTWLIQLYINLYNGKEILIKFASRCVRSLKNNGMILIIVSIAARRLNPQMSLLESPTANVRLLIPK